MSVSNPIIDYIDGPNRIIYLRSNSAWPVSKIINGKLTWSPVDDIYPEVRTLRRLDENLRKYDMFCEALPLISKGGNDTTGRGLTLLLGTRIVPFDESQSQNITGELLSDEGISGLDLIDVSTLSPETKIKLSYEPPPATEVVVIDGNGNSVSLSDEDLAKIAALNNNSCQQFDNMSYVLDTETLFYALPEPISAQLSKNNLIATEIDEEQLTTQFEPALKVVELCTN